jgi:hypothetical protein
MSQDGACVGVFGVGWAMGIGQFGAFNSGHGQPHLETTKGIKTNVQDIKMKSWDELGRDKGGAAGFGGNMTLYWPLLT